MKILLDECLPKRLKTSLKQFEVKTVTEMGWNSLRNGQLMKVAIEKNFQILLTIDKNIEFQQNLKSYPISVALLIQLKSLATWVNETYYLKLYLKMD